MTLWLLTTWLGCTGDGSVGDGLPPVSRGGLAVRLVVAPDESEPVPCDEGSGDDDDDDDDDDDETDLSILALSRIDVRLDELRLALDERSLLVPVARDLDIEHLLPTEVEV
ncbi:MAG: hypothetical protein AAF211_31770, partial [Myxococcota bacterium]